MNFWDTIRWLVIIGVRDNHDSTSISRIKRAKMTLDKEISYINKLQYRSG